MLDRGDDVTLDLLSAAAVEHDGRAEPERASAGKREREAVLCRLLGDDHRLQCGQASTAVLLRSLKAPQARLSCLSLQGTESSTGDLAGIGGKVLLDRQELAAHEVGDRAGEQP